MQPRPPWPTRTVPPSTRCWAQTRGALLGEDLPGNVTSRTAPASCSTPGNSVPQMEMCGKVRFAPGDGYKNMHILRKQIHTARCQAQHTVNMYIIYVLCAANADKYTQVTVCIWHQIQKFRKDGFDGRAHTNVWKPQLQIEGSNNS